MPFVPCGAITYRQDQHISNLIHYNTNSVVDRATMLLINGTPMKTLEAHPLASAVFKLFPELIISLESWSHQDDLTQTDYVRISFFHFCSVI
jgi:hypothetical protein